MNDTITTMNTHTKCKWNKEVKKIAKEAKKRKITNMSQRGIDKIMSPWFSQIFQSCFTNY